MITDKMFAKHINQRLYIDISMFCRTSSKHENSNLFHAMLGRILHNCQTFW